MAKRGPREYPWFRFYVETTRDLKIRLEPVTTRWAWVAVLSLARRSPQPGRLLLSNGVPVTTALIADEANVTPRAAEAALATFRAKEMVGQDAAGVLTVINWGKRQPEMKGKRAGNTPELDGEFPANSTQLDGKFASNSRQLDGKFDASLLLEVRSKKVPSEPTEAEAEVDPGPVHPAEKASSGVVASAIARAREAAAVPPNGSAMSPQMALRAAARIAFGFTGQTTKERERENKAASDLVKAGVTPDEFAGLVTEYRRRGWPEPSLSAIAGRLGQLRAPAEPGRRVTERDEPRGFEGVRGAFADVFAAREGA